MPSLVFKRDLRSDDLDSVGAALISGDNYLLEGLVHNGLGGAVLESDDQQTYTLAQGDYQRRQVDDHGGFWTRAEDGTTRGHQTDNWRADLVVTCMALPSDFWNFFDRVATGDTFYLVDYDGTTKTVVLASRPIARRGHGSRCPCEVRLQVRAQSATP